MVQEAYHSDWEVLAVVVSEDSMDKCAEVYVLYEDKLTYFTTAKDFRTLSSQENPEGIIAIVVIPPSATFLQADPDWNKLREGPGFILDRIQDPGNLGTILRIAHWFGWRQIICLEGTVDMLNPKTLRSSMGAVFHVDVYYCKAVAGKLAFPGRKIWLADMEGVSLRETKFDKNDLFLMGNEAGGVDPLLRAHSKYGNIHIPGAGQAESLNVAVASGIIAYEYHEQHKAI